MSNETTSDTDHLDMGQARNRLAWLWICGTAPSLVPLIVQNVLGKLHGEEGTVWLWYFARISQTILLVISSMSGHAIVDKAGIRKVSRTYYRITATLSLTYLVLLVVVIVAEGIRPGANRAAEFFQSQQRYLDFLQMLAVAALATFFGAGHGTANEKPKPTTDSAVAAAATAPGAKADHATDIGSSE